MSLLLLGKNGQVGWELRRTLSPLGRVIALGRAQADLTQPDLLRRIVREHAPRLIVNAAAYTAVDKAESEPELAQAINGTAPGVLAEEAKRLGALLVHYSTDYVFDGGKEGLYTEADIPNPLNVYGKTKLAGERAIAAAGSEHLIFRTSWVYGARGKNFFRTLRRLSREKESLNIVNDQIGAPTWSRLIAQVTATVLARCWDETAGPALAGRGGVYHLTAAGQASWHEFAQAIIEGDLHKEAQTVRNLHPIPTTQYPTPARRPANSRMECSRLCRNFGVTLPPWREGLNCVWEEAEGSGD